MQASTLAPGSKKTLTYWYFQKIKVLFGFDGKIIKIFFHIQFHGKNHFFSFSHSISRKNYPFFHIPAPRRRCTISSWPADEAIIKGVQRLVRKKRWG